MVQQTSAIDVVRAELAQLEESITQVEKDLAARKAAAGPLKRVLAKLQESGHEPGVIAPGPVELALNVPVPTVAVERRVMAMAKILRERGPMGPGELREAVERELSNGEVTRAQINDVLRRRKNTFRKIKRGQYGLKEAHG